MLDFRLKTHLRKNLVPLTELLIGEVPWRVFDVEDDQPRRRSPRLLAKHQESDSENRSGTRSSSSGTKSPKKVHFDIPRKGSSEAPEPCDIVRKDHRHIAIQVDATEFGYETPIGVPLLDRLPELEYREETIERVAEIVPDWTDEEWMEAQRNDPILARVCDLLTLWIGGDLDPKENFRRELVLVKHYCDMFPELEFSADTRILCRRVTCDASEHPSGALLQRVVPHGFRVALFHRVHRHELLHYGYEKVYNTLKRRFYWYNMSQDVLEWCQACESCQTTKPGMKGSKNPLKQSNVVYQPMQRLGIDLLTFSTKTSRGNRNILVVQDYASKWTELFALPDKTAITVEAKLYEEIMLRYGACVNLHSDQGLEFDNQLMKLITRRWGITKTRTSGFAPWSNGQVERINRSIKTMILQFGEAHPTDWDLFLSHIRGAINNAIASSTGHTPHKVFFSQCCDARMPLDLMACGKALTDDGFTCMTDYIVKQEVVQCEILNSVRSTMNSKLRLQAKQFERGGLRIRTYKPGDLILRRCNPAERDVYEGRKWRGPERIVEIDDTGHNVKIWVPAIGRPKDGKPLMQLKWIHTSRIKPCRLDSQGRLLLLEEGEEISADIESMVSINKIEFENCSHDNHSILEEGGNENHQIHDWKVLTHPRDGVPRIPETVTFCD